MASKTNLPGMTWLPNDSVYRGHAMSIGRMALIRIEGCGTRVRTAGPRHAFAQGRTLPISRGSPPFYDS
jgi:hypothetical protein